MTLEKFGFKRVAADDAAPAKKQKTENENVSPSIELEIPESWKNALNNEFEKEYFKNLQKLVASERMKWTIYPPANEVFSFMNCKIEDIKIVIIGQDPYHGQKQACGKAFSVHKGIKIPPSLRNIYAELKNDIPDFEIPTHGDLTSWVSEGVFLLNACLTVRKATPNSHKDFGWYKFTDAIIRTINEQCKNVVFLLWGAFAQQKAGMISKADHLVLKAPHPSPFSVHKGFYGCKHFSIANEYLKNNGKSCVNWKIE